MIQMSWAKCILFALKELPFRPTTWGVAGPARRPPATGSTTGRRRRHCRTWRSCWQNGGKWRGPRPARPGRPPARPQNSAAAPSGHLPPPPHRPWHLPCCCPSPAAVFRTGIGCTRQRHSLKIQFSIPEKGSVARPPLVWVRTVLGNYSFYDSRPIKIIPNCPKTNVIYDSLNG